MVTLDMTPCKRVISHRHFSRACFPHIQGSTYTPLTTLKTKALTSSKASIITSLHGAISQNAVTIKMRLCGIKWEDREELGQGSELARSLLLRQLKVNRRMWRDRGGTRPTASNNGTPPLTRSHKRTNKRSPLHS